MNWLFRIKNTFFKKKSTRANTWTHILENLYRSIDGVYISHAERDRLQINDTSFTYGEITYEGFASMLAITQPQPGETLYDLGSGTGKALFCAALLYDWEKCVGIELLPGLYQVSQELLKNFLIMDEIKSHFSNKRMPIEFIFDDFLNIDFSNADIIFLNATTLNPVLWGELEKKLNDLKAGARVIVGSKKLSDQFFMKIHQALYPMSWGDCTVFIYRKR